MIILAAVSAQELSSIGFTLILVNPTRELTEVCFPFQLDPGARSMGTEFDAVTNAKSPRIARVKKRSVMLFVQPAEHAAQ